MGRHRLPFGHAVRSEAARIADSGVRPELTARGVDGGLECNTQATGVSGIDGGTGEGDEMDTVAASRIATCAAEGRKERSQAVPGASTKIHNVETARHDGTHEGLETGKSGSREATEQGRVEESEGGECTHSKGD